MQPPQTTTRRWMVVVAVVGLMSSGIRWGGFLALALEVPILGVSLAIWMVKMKRPLAAGIMGGAVLLWLIVGLLLPPVTTSLGVGHTNVQISFVVLDADTGQPVEGATIHLRHPDLTEI